MVWVCPPHTSMNLYWRPGSHSAAIFAASARALSASRNSSTKRIVRTLLLDQRLAQCRDLVLIRLADALEELHGRGRLGLVDLGQGEADVDQHPLARLGRVIGQQPDVDQPPDAADVHLGEDAMVGVHFDDLARYGQAHVAPAALGAPGAPGKSWSELPGSGQWRRTGPRRGSRCCPARPSSRP